jgi:nickel-dependent lactate racemase
MKLALPYGDSAATGELDWARCLGVLDIADVPELPDLDGAIRQAIEQPIGLDKNIYEMVAPGRTATILVSDMFRYTGAELFLPILIEGLNRAGLPDEAVSILFATGAHRRPTEDEKACILGPEMYRRFRTRTRTHDPYDDANLVYIGTTSRGTPLRINRLAHEADLLIATGAVVFHYFGGFGGGRKSILPGIASVDAISHNHAMNLHPVEDRLDPAVQIGVLDGNPVAEDMLECARLVGVDYVINTVLNRQSRIAAVFAGDIDAAHRAAAAYARDVFSVTISKRADLVIASVGAAKNFVQSHKALYNAYQAVKPGGRIIFLARCKEGLGGETFTKWLRLGSRKAIIAGLRRQSEINGQTALSTIEKAPMTLFITEMPESDVRTLGGRKVESLKQALDVARNDLASVEDPTAYIMPSASYTVPFLRA